jgi:hypothetical protein
MLHTTRGPRGMIRLATAVCIPLVILLVAGLALTGCGKELDPTDDPKQVDAMSPPAVGGCRTLVPAQVDKADNATKTVACSKKHTAETYAAGKLPKDLKDAAYGSREVALASYRLCSDAFAKHLGADDSMVMRTVLSWAWFRPSKKAWDDGARWYRCDLIGGGGQALTEGAQRYLPLPAVTKGLLRGIKPSDDWMVCADGRTVRESPKVPCTDKHTWRAVTTIKLGEKKDPYPGDHTALIKTRDLCRSSVEAWLGYPISFQFGFTWFHEAEWEAGNRRSICWARTEH